MRFHALNGLVSLVGNVALMALLAGRLHVDPIVANIAAIVTCSLINFAASEALVFRSSPRPRRARVAGEHARAS
jgi:putative flippase GtrA